MGDSAGKQPCLHRSGHGPHASGGMVIERSVILAGAHIGEGCELRECIAGDGASVGDGTKLTGGAVLGEHVRIGADNVIARGARIFPGVVLPDGAIKF